MIKRLLLLLVLLMTFGCATTPHVVTRNYEVVPERVIYVSQPRDASDEIRDLSRLVEEMNRLARSIDLLLYEIDNIGN